MGGAARDLNVGTDHVGNDARVRTLCKIVASMEGWMLHKVRYRHNFYLPCNIFTRTAQATH